MILRFGSGAILIVLLAIAGVCRPQPQQATPHANGISIETKPPTSEDLPDSQRVEAGEYKVLSEDGIGPFVPNETIGPHLPKPIKSRFQLIFPPISISSTLSILGFCDGVPVPVR
ncbi:MAG: hypothetical protein ABSD20_12890 [Terriglobales bacterium]